jgi:hypothetical protein
MIASSFRRFARASAAVLLGVSLCGAIPVLAQDQPAAGAQRGAQAGRMMGQVLLRVTPPLNDKQKARIRELRAEMLKQNENLTDREQRRANIKAFYDKIDGVLTPPQRVDFKKKMDAARAKYRAEHPEAFASPPGSH